MGSSSEGATAGMSLTEARVLSVLLGASLESEGERIVRSGLPRSTYEDARRRVYGQGIVEDRYVPDPRVFGRRWATAMLVRPYADELSSLVARWSASPDNVLVWRGPESVFAVFLHAGPRPEVEGGNFGSGSRQPASASQLTVDLARPSVPIYFDYEGAWTHVAGVDALWQYPRPLVAEPGVAVSPSEGSRRVAADLVFRSGPDTSGGRPPHLMGPYALPRSSRRLVERGWLQWRAFPRLRALKLTDGRGADSVVLVFAGLKEGRSPGALFRELSMHRSFPFLFMTEGQRVLLGFLATRAAAEASSEGAAGDVLLENLTQVEAHRASIEDLQEVVSHRYAGVVRPAPGPGSQRAQHLVEAPGHRLRT